MLWITMVCAFLAVYFAVMLWRQTGEVLMLRFAIRQSSFLAHSVLSPEHELYSGTVEQAKALEPLRNNVDWLRVHYVLRFLEDFDYKIPEERELGEDVIRQGRKLLEELRAKKAAKELSASTRQRNR